MKKVMLALGLLLFVGGLSYGEEPDVWARYLGSMNGKAFPIIFLSKVENGETVSKTGVYLYQGKEHPVVGVIQGPWDSWRSTLKGRWRELEWIGDDLSDLYGGPLTLVISQSGIDGFRQLDDDDQTYEFSVTSEPVAPDSDEKGMFIQAFLKYVAWQKSHS